MKETCHPYVYASLESRTHSQNFWPGMAKLLRAAVSDMLDKMFKMSLPKHYTAICMAVQEHKQETYYSIYNHSDQGCMIKWFQKEKRIVNKWANIKKSPTLCVLFPERQSGLNWDIPLENADWSALLTVEKETAWGCSEVIVLGLNKDNYIPSCSTICLVFPLRFPLSLSLCDSWQCELTGGWIWYIEQYHCGLFDWRLGTV